MIYLPDIEVQAAPGTVGFHASTTTHDISRTSFHVKHIGQFARRLEDVWLLSTPYSNDHINTVFSPQHELSLTVEDRHKGIRRFRRYYYTGTPMISLSFPSWRISRNAFGKTTLSTRTSLAFLQKIPIWS
jgi:hypothetical protein